MRDIMIIGASGHAEVIIDMLHCINRRDGREREIKLLDDDASLLGKYVMGHKVVGRIEECVNYKDCEFVVAIGNNQTRKRIVQQYDLNYICVVHPSAIIAENVKMGEGTVVMPGAVINSGAVLGRHCIVNTGATVDHDNTLDDFVHLSPGVHLGGNVSVGLGSWLGIGSCCKNNVAIAADIVVGAGSCVVRDLQKPGTYVGIPARQIK